MSDHDPNDFWTPSRPFLGFVLSLLWIGWIAGSIWLFDKVRFFAIPLNLITLSVCWLCTRAALPSKVPSAAEHGKPIRKRSPARIVLLVLTASLALPAIVLVLLGLFYYQLVRNCSGRI